MVADLLNEVSKNGSSLRVILFIANPPSLAKLSLKYYTLF